MSEISQNNWTAIYALELYDVFRIVRVVLGCRGPVYTTVYIIRCACTCTEPYSVGDTPSFLWRGNLSEVFAPKAFQNDVTTSDCGFGLFGPLVSVDW